MPTEVHHKEMEWEGGQQQRKSEKETREGNKGREGNLISISRQNNANQYQTHPLFNTFYLSNPTHVSLSFYLFLSLSYTLTAIIHSWVGIWDKECEPVAAGEKKNPQRTDTLPSTYLHWHYYTPLYPKGERQKEKEKIWKWKNKETKWIMSKWVQERKEKGA